MQRSGAIEAVASHGGAISQVSASKILRLFLQQLPLDRSEMTANFTLPQNDTVDLSQSVERSSLFGRVRSECG